MRGRHRFGGPICAIHLAEAAAAAANLARPTGGLQLARYQVAAPFVAWKAWHLRSGGKPVSTGRMPSSVVKA